MNLVILIILGFCAGITTGALIGYTATELKVDKPKPKKRIRKN